MPLSDLSPNRNGTTTTATANNSTNNSLLSSALRRSPRLRPSLLPPGMNADADDSNADGSGTGSGTTRSSSNVNLRLQLEQLRSEAQSNKQLLDSIRDVVAAASTAASSADGGNGQGNAAMSAEEALVQLRTLLGVGIEANANGETLPADASDDDQVMADGPDLDETIAMDEYYEGTSALDRSDLDIMLGPGHHHPQEDEESDDSDNKMQPKRQQKIVLDDDDGDDEEQDDSFEEDFAPKDEDATAQEKVQSTPSPDRPFDETPSKCSSHSSSTTASIAVAPSSTNRLPPSSTKRGSIAGSAASSAKSSSYSMTPDRETDDNDDEEEKDLSTSYGNDDSMEASGGAASAAGAASTASSTPKTTKMVYDDDDEDEAEEDEYEASSSNRKAKSVKKSDKKKRRKTIALREDSLLRASPSPSTTASGTPKVSGGRGTPKSTPSSVSSKSAAGGIAVGDDDKTSPPNRKSTGSGGTASVGAGSSAATAMSHSTPASHNSGDSYSLAAKAKDSMQKASVYTTSTAGGATKVVRRSARRRTLEIQSQTNSLSAMTAPSPASSTMSRMSMPSPAMSDAPPPHMSASRSSGCETPMLPSPAPTDGLGMGSLISLGGLASVQEGDGDAADVPAAAPAALADGDRPPLPPKRSSRRKSVLPERLRQEDVLLDPTLTPNSQMKETAEKQEQQENRATSTGPLPASIGIELADSDEPVAAKKVAAPSESQSSAGTQPQKKRRRRSSVGGLVAGGLLSAKEIEGLSAHAESKKRSKNSTQQQSSRKRSHEAAEISSSEPVTNDVAAAPSSAAPSSAAPAETSAPVEMKPPSEQVEATSAPKNDGAAPMECDVQQQEMIQAQAAPVEQVDQTIDTCGGKIVKVSVVGEEGTIDALVANEGIPHVEVPAPYSPKPDTPKQEERILVAAPSPQIQEDDDPLGLKSTIPAPKDDGSAPTEPSRPTVIRKTFSFDGEAINARAIKKRIPQLFPDNSAITQPCASARLFACASIVLESSKADAGGRAKRPSDQLRYVLPTLAAFVNAELVSLSGETPSKADTKRKKLHFSSFDGSTTMPPVDRMSGSHSHLEKNIVSLETVFKEVDSLAKKASNAKDDAIVEEIKECLDAIIFTMHHIESDAGTGMMNECAESMPFHWPAKRFAKAARTYREELEEVHLLLDNKSSNDSALRSRLGDFIGRSIRFYFRRFFDPVPLNLTNEQHENYRHVDLSGTRSRVCEIVEMVDPEGDGRDTAAADGSISSVFSYALRAIHALFAINAERATADGEYFNTFFSSGASQRGLGPGRSPTIVLSDADLDEILADIHDVHIVLQGIKAARFLSALLHWPGVSKAVKDAGGWNKVESFARVFENLDLEKACPEEAYFTLLGGIDGLLQRIDADAEKMAQIEHICEDNLRNCWKRFRCGTKSKAILQQNPHITTIAAYLRDGKSLSFPALAEPSEESEEEEE